MRRALDDNPTNVGFRRDEASLAVIAFADNDDCSVADYHLFDATQTELDSELGPLDIYRCFEFGVECEPDGRFEFGTRENCRPRADSPFHHDIGRYTDFLRDIVLPERLTFGSLHGPIEPVTVDEASDGRPFLRLSCSNPWGAAPGIRMQALVDRLATAACGHTLRR